MSGFIKIRFEGPDKATETNFSVRSSTKMELLILAYARKCRLPTKNLHCYVNDSILIKLEDTPASLGLKPSSVITVYETIFDPAEEEAEQKRIQQSNFMEKYARNGDLLMPHRLERQPHVPEYSIANNNPTPAPCASSVQEKLSPRVSPSKLDGPTNDGPEALPVDAKTQNTVRDLRSGDFFAKLPSKFLKNNK